MAKVPRRLVYYCAVSADGFIARKDGSVDWLESRAAEDYGIEEFLRGIDTIVWGRATFEGYGMKPPGLEPFGDGVRHIVLSHRPPAVGADPRAEFTTATPQALAGRLRSQAGKDVWLMGGGISAASFLDAGELDELFVHVIPVPAWRRHPVVRDGAAGRATGPDGIEGVPGWRGAAALCSAPLTRPARPRHPRA